MLTPRRPQQGGQRLDLGIHVGGGQLGKEHAVAFALAMKRDQSEALAHAELAHHLARDGGRVFDVLLGAGCDVAKYDFFGGAAAHGGRHAGDQLGL